jgi:hypothetical protein
MHRTAITAAALALLAGASTAVAQESRESTGDTFDWNGKIPAGAWVRVQNLSGSIDVDASSSGETQVHAVKNWHRGDPQRVRFQISKDGNNVTICALWDDDDSCYERGYHSRGHHGDRSDDVSVHFTVHLAKGVNVDAGTVNGSVDVRDASGQVEAHTVNGRVEAASSGGPVSASTVNGSVVARMGALGRGDDDLDFSTVNGSVTVEVPTDFGGEVDMETVNGSLRTDFPMTVSGRLDPKHIRATIGTGRRRVRLHTVNGSVELRKLS